MKSLLVSYATASFQDSQRRLAESALRHGMSEVRSWSRAELEQTLFYETHKALLDLRRGSGYWLWKPFIILEGLQALSDGDILIYSDAGIEVVADLSPLLNLCAERVGILLFAGHYDDAGGPGPNLCGKWTKRDCFLSMGCDEPRYHEGQVLDASFLVLKRTPRSLTFIREWLLYCSQSHILNDEPNTGELPNLPGFIEHRHDQSILSLLAIRDGLEIFRHPSQFGNHLKDEPYRCPGEWIRFPYGSRGISFNSPYGTLLNHHRRQNIVLQFRRVLPVTRKAVFSLWNEPELLKKWWGAFGLETVNAEIDLRPGGSYFLEMAEPEPSGLEQSERRRLCISGTYAEVLPPQKLVYGWRWTTSRLTRLKTLETQVTVEFCDCTETTEVLVRHGEFADETVADRHATCWHSSLDRLAALLHATRHDSPSNTLSGKS